MTPLIRRVRPCLLAHLCLLLLVPAAHAVTMGPIDAQSSLYEKFRARILVTNLGDADRMQLRASLADADDFARLGVERFFYLSDLRFEVISRGEQQLIEISSSQVITEPYLDFVVELTWRGGRVLRNYTVFLDPLGWVEAAQETPTVAARQTTANSRPAEPVAREGRYYGPTTANDTLWTIALATRDNEQISVYQQMIGIKRLNPQAFIADNINQLKRDQQLLLPTASQATALSHNEAVRQAEVESTAWQTERENTPKLPAAAGRLRIVTDPAPVPDIATASDSEAPEDAANANPESAEVADLLAPTRNRIAALDQAITRQDQEIAALKLQVQEVQAALGTLKSRQPQPPAPSDSFLQRWLLPLLWTSLGITLLLWVIRRTRPQWRASMPSLFSTTANAKVLRA